MKRKKLFFLIFISFSFLIIAIFLILVKKSKLAQLNSFDTFEQQDKKTFNNLINKTESCINNREFDCAEKLLKKAKKYILSKKDSEKISELYAKIEEKKEEETYYGEPERTNEGIVSISLLDCNNDGSRKTCTLKVKYASGDIKYFTLVIKPNNNGYEIWVQHYLAIAADCQYIPSFYERNLICAVEGSTQMFTVSSLSEAVKKTIEASREKMNRW
jgi:hypothetical protein